ncbi:unnamed protein product [Lepeophtheirus salmonis]|uniref:(salmon louse) hypothetical protein n=1 Tax=Lepeophtheirus salmonis TaxID=72036 RepID=A0A7R8D301_LEPSM|nr:unnamed protein product [Lepeophtheirus salmonis]CAF2960798.1 unnamed protein product [Lepeophtheirus salmonis]
MKDKTSDPKVSSSSLGEFVRAGGERLSLRFEKERNREWVQKQFQPKVPNRNSGASPLPQRESVLLNGHNTTPEIEEEEEAGLSCVICIGSTGAGKSSTISKCTSQRAKCSSGTERETKKCAKYHRLGEHNGSIWVDTVGWDDIDCEDADSFKEVLRFIDKNDIMNVKAILWNVIPNIRRDALLSKQAAIIDLFKPGEIWNNVIIVLKQSMNPENDGKGALRAALEYNAYANIQVVGYRFFEDPTISEAQRETQKTREVFNIKTNEEVRAIIDEKLEDIRDPIQVVFHNSKCADCTEVGDIRLMSSYCHMKPYRIHPGDIEQYHPKKTELFHPSEHYIYEHDGILKKPWYSISCLCRIKRYSCCNRKSGKQGCAAKWACCKDPVQKHRRLNSKNSPNGYQYQIPTYNISPGCKTRYKCCKVDTSSGSLGCQSKYSCCSQRIRGGSQRLSQDDDGCQVVCKNCNKPWGSPAGNCFKKDHNIKDINWVEPKKEEPSFEEDSSTPSTPEPFGIKRLDSDLNELLDWDENDEYVDLVAPVIYHIV